MRSSFTRYLILKSYLSDRYFQVMVEASLRLFWRVEVDVLKGNILDCILFKMKPAIYYLIIFIYFLKLN